MERRTWLKSSIGIGGMLIAPQLIAAQAPKIFTAKRKGSPIRLSSNENPYGPSQRVQNAIQEAFVHGCRYPYTYADELADILAKKHGVSPESIIITGGSTEGLRITGLTFASGGGEIIAAQPTFLAMMDYARQWGAKIAWVPVGEDKGYDLDAIEERIHSNTKLVFLCNPNNPTGTLLPAKKLVDFCESATQKTIVFSDEAYYDFIEIPNYPSMIDLVKKGEDVVVSRTFSKVYGLAGLRIGYLLIIRQISSYRFI